MFSFESDTQIGNLGVTTTEYRGHTVEEVADMATKKIVSVSDEAPAPIREQAHAFEKVCKKVIAYYMQQAVNNHICTICNLLEKQGHKDLANIIRRL
jgi:hypothetical protein|tara:strand:+ start:361 stop:651 length:291 start_codon:yes stop_codon:yes gene_type:complete